MHRCMAFAFRLTLGAPVYPCIRNDETTSTKVVDDSAFIVASAHVPPAKPSLRLAGGRELLKDRRGYKKTPSSEAPRVDEGAEDLCLAVATRYETVGKASRATWPMISLQRSRLLFQ